MSHYKKGGLERRTVKDAAGVETTKEEAVGASWDSKGVGMLMVRVHKDGGAKPFITFTTEAVRRGGLRASRFFFQIPAALRLPTLEHCARGGSDGPCLAASVTPQGSSLLPPCRPALCNLPKASALCSARSGRGGCPPTTLTFPASVCPAQPQPTRAGPRAVHRQHQQGHEADPQRQRQPRELERALEPRWQSAALAADGGLCERGGGEAAAWCCGHSEVLRPSPLALTNVTDVSLPLRKHAMGWCRVPAPLPAGALPAGQGETQGAPCRGAEASGADAVGGLHRLRALEKEKRRKDYQ